MINSKPMLLSSLLLIILMLGLFVGVARAGSGLPDRDTPTENDRNDDLPLGATIELVAWPPNAMSVVQWQDVNGEWQDVEGWRGNLDHTGHISWWVAAKDFGSGPFRWMVGDAVSQPFHLPAGAGQTVQARLAAKP